MFAQLKAAAASAASAGYAAATDVAVAAKERVDVAQSAKKMVDEGGEPVATKLLAKKASSEVTALDKKLVAHYTETLEAYGVATQKLEEAQAHSEGENPSFQKLNSDYAARATAMREGLQKLNQPIPQAVTISTVEADAIQIVVAKSKASGVRSSLANLSLTGSCDEDEAGQSEAGGGWMQKAQSAFDVARQRVDAAMPGKKMVDEGGPPMAAKLLAKKASGDVIWADQRMMTELQQTIDIYESTATNLRASIPIGEGENPPFDTIAAAYETRAAALKQVMSSLPAVPEAAACSAEEKNGILYLVASNKVSETKAVVSTAVKEAHGKATEMAMGK